MGRRVNRWAGPQGKLGSYINEEVEETIEAYRVQPRRVDEDANKEEDTARGGYAHRQLLELIQNSADALANTDHGGRIDIQLTDTYLYCADDGRSIDEDGVRALMSSHMSPKRGTSEIGRFGVGFKSVLGLTDAPEFFSCSGSFRFDRGRSRKRIRKVVPKAVRYPVLRLPEPIDPHEYADKDRVLQKFMTWATNIVRLPFKPGAVDDLIQQLHDFPSEFLLFVKHVHQIKLTDTKSSIERTLGLEKTGGIYRLSDGERVSEWKLFRTEHRLSEDALDDRRSLDDVGEVPIWWAAPLDDLTRPGKFWAFFPTETSSLVAGILNAPWKTNEDRQNLLRGRYNEELIETAVRLVVDGLPDLATEDDPARHLDVLPRLYGVDDTYLADLLRTRLFSELAGHEIVPDQDGNLRLPNEISYPPVAPDGGMKMWGEYSGRPSGWLHFKAVTRIRFPKIDQLFDPPGAPRVTIAEWLESLFEDKSEDELIQASMIAIRIAANIPDEMRRQESDGLGNIVITASGDRVKLDPDRIFLPHDSSDSSGAEDSTSFVHSDLALDPDTYEALRTLGFKQPSPDSAFRHLAKRILGLDDGEEPCDDLNEKFWIASRRLSVSNIREILQGYYEVRERYYYYHWRRRDYWLTKLRVRTRAGTWRSPYSVLLPGEIVPGDGSRDDDATVDVLFHTDDADLLQTIGVTDKPLCERDLSLEPEFDLFRRLCVDGYLEQDNLSSTPRYTSNLKFKSDKGVGPLEVMKTLSDEGGQLFTEKLLLLDDTYHLWTMRHGTVRSYPEMQCRQSFQVYMLEKYGKINVSGIIVPLADAFGSRPQNPAALDALLKHPKFDKIKEAFDIIEPEPELIGESDPIPLADVWPGLDGYLSMDHRLRSCQLVRCERILVTDQEKECILHDHNIYLLYGTDEDGSYQLKLINDALALDLHEDDIGNILEYTTPEEIEERRAAVRDHSTDAERLLAAVGEQGLQECLPDSLHSYLENPEHGDESSGGIEIAKAAIAIYDTDALRQCRRSLEHLDPPRQWAGSAPAIKFVQSLGFSERWAGERGRKRSPSVKVEGPYSLPELHEYQKTIVANIQGMLYGKRDDSVRRGMVSMPTGSGKTRVAVQAIVDAMREGYLTGGVIWVADRDELCEQAVEAWRQVWSNIGARAPLQISRMWDGQPRPLPTSEHHVIVATIQTLRSRFKRHPDTYQFLLESNLVVFDEAHRSIAPSFTSVMQEIGLTRRQEEDEPFLIGLTATPYRGYSEEETRWLANRYGSNRLDFGAFPSDDPQDTVRELQRMKVLAQADQKVIEGGTFRLEEDELSEMAKFASGSDESEQHASLAWLPLSAANRIAHDVERTERIIDACRKIIRSDGPTLIFATSVEHAQILTVLLNRKGIKARSVDADTEPTIRRRVVEEFRRGEIKALVNYGVFREGFDAPKTRAIVVARPVYSPNLYFQMIGRGLRGPKNGGDDRCLILNVRDNIENFDRALAFSDLDWLWAKRPAQ